MKKYLYIILFTLITFFIGLFIHQKNELAKYKRLYDKELQNVEAYQAANSGLKGSIRQYQMTMDDLKASKDSLDKKLIEVVESLKIKEKRVEYVQYQTKVINKTDTIQLSDTVFVPETHIDTTLGDEWYTMNLKLDYPSKITTSPTFNSEQYVVINTKKEYDKKPSKLFFIRWFQKKHWVTEVNVVEKNPYVENKEHKFIKIVK